MFCLLFFLLQNPRLCALKERVTSCQACATPQAMKNAAKTARGPWRAQATALSRCACEDGAQAIRWEELAGQQATQPGSGTQGLEGLVLRDVLKMTIRLN